MTSPLKAILISLPLLFVTYGTAGAAETPATANASAESKTPSDTCETDQGSQASRSTDEVTSKTASADTHTADDSSGDTNVSSDNRGKTSTEIVKEIVDNPKPSEGGQMVAETGRARPVESWFGCPPN